MQDGSEYELMNAQVWQRSIDRWMQECFGPEIASDKRERAHRFIEEAIELVQAGGLPKEEVLMLVDYVYGRPVGEVFQEVGGVMVTLSAFCTPHNVSLERAANMERDRVFVKMETIREKQKAKPRNSPLPE